MMRKSLSMLIPLFFLTLLPLPPILAGKVEEIPIQPKAAWTLVVYMNGDNDLEPSIPGDGGCPEDMIEAKLEAGDFFPSTLLSSPAGARTNAAANTPYIHGDFHNELAIQGSNKDIHVVALVDRVPGYSDKCDNWTETRLYYIQKGDYPDNTHGTYWVNATNPEMNMGDPTTIVWLLEKAQTYFPSEKLYLSIWDHNWGWHAGWFEEDETSEELGLQSDIPYGQMYDVLTRAKEENKIPHIDVLGYDACVSAQIEVMHSWRPFADNFAGSQDYVGWGGVDYEIVIGAIQDKPSVLPKDLSKIIATSMMTDPEDNCASSSALNVDFDELVSRVDILAKLLIENMDTMPPKRLEKIREKVPATPSWYQDLFHRDLYQVALQISLGLPKYPDIVEAANDIMHAFNKTVDYNYAKTTTEKSNLCLGGNGITIYWTKRGQKPDEDYYDTSFARATAWDEFLDKFSKK